MDAHRTACHLHEPDWLLPLRVHQMALRRLEDRAVSHQLGDAGLKESIWFLGLVLRVGHGLGRGIPLPNEVRSEAERSLQGVSGRYSPRVVRRPVTGRIFSK